MYSALAACIVAAIVSAILTPLVRDVALASGAVDAPDARRMHQRLIPRLGGIAIVLGFFAPLGVLFFLETSVAQTFFDSPLLVVGLGAGGVIVSVLGAIDDVRGIRAWRKLLIQSVAAIVAFACGYRIEAVDIPLMGTLDMGAFALPVTIVWIVGLINAINLIDGLDGLAAGIAFFVCVANFVVGYLNESALVMLLSGALAGSILGFLLYNFNPATIFMGDSGSMFLGYVLATSSLLGAAIKSSTTVAILVPILALGIPIMDTLLAMVRRFVERRPIFSPDRGHIHHRLVDLGLTHRRAVLLLYGCSLLLAIAAIVSSLDRNWEVGAALIMMSLVVTGLFRAVRGFDALRFSRRQRARAHAPSTERFRRHLPELLSRLHSANGPQAASRELARFAAHTSLRSCEVVTENGATDQSFSWVNEQDDCEGRRDHHTVVAEYTLEHLGNAIIRFVWDNNYGDVSPQDEILLQLVADSYEKCVARRDAQAEPVRTSDRLPQMRPAQAR